MTDRICAAVLGSMLAASLAPVQVQAESPALPDTYALVSTVAMGGGPMTVEVRRNGSKELVEMTRTAGDPIRLRQLYDFQARRVYTQDLITNTCTTQEYTSPFAPVQHDPIGGWPEMQRQMTANPPRVLRTESVNGIAARVVEFALDDGAGKFTYWLEEKHGFPVKQAVTIESQREVVLFEVRQVGYEASPARLFAPPPECTRIKGVSSATGGHAEVEVEVKVQQTVELGDAPAAPAGKGGTGK